MVSFTMLYPLQEHIPYETKRPGIHTIMHWWWAHSQPGRDRFDWILWMLFCLYWEITVCKTGRFVGKDHVWRSASTKRILREKPLVWQNIILRKFISESSSLNLGSHDSLLPGPTEATILKSSAAESYIYFPTSTLEGPSSGYSSRAGHRRPTFLSVLGMLWKPSSRFQAAKDAIKPS